MSPRLALAGAAVALVAAAATADLSAAQRKPAALKPLVLRENCISKAERRCAVRFTTFDRVRLIGVELGLGPRESSSPTRAGRRRAMAVRVDALRASARPPGLPRARVRPPRLRLVGRDEQLGAGQAGRLRRARRDQGHARAGANQFVLPAPRSEGRRCCWPRRSRAGTDQRRDQLCEPSDVWPDRRAERVAGAACPGPVHLGRRGRDAFQRTHGRMYDASASPDKRLRSCREPSTARPSCAIPPRVRSWTAGFGEHFGS